MSQRVRQIHCDLVIADQWTEPHSPWQNPSELNGTCVKYLMTHAQVLLDRTGASYSMRFLAQDYLHMFTILGKTVKSTGKYHNRS
jgi:hypothetical protein